MEYNLYENRNELSLYMLTSKDTKVNEISNGFLTLTGYEMMDFMGKSIDYVFKLIKLRKIEDYYILITKDFDVINIYLNIYKNLYTFSKVKNGSMREKFKYYDDIHINKGRGLAVYNVSKLVLLKANAEYENLLSKQYGVKDVQIGNTFYEISNNNLINSRLPFLKKVIKTGNVLNLEFFKCETVLNKDIFLETTFIPIYEDNQIKYIIESYYDVTERENQKGQNILLEKQKEFFFFICHEFKMPLTVILSAIQMVKGVCKSEVSPSCFKYTKKIKQASMQQLRLVNNILDVLKSDTGTTKLNKNNLDIIALSKAITDSSSVYAITKGVNIKFESSIDKLIIGIDNDKYERILLNLLSNAIKFTPKSKNICVKIDIIDTSVRIEVEDEGVGISKDKLGVIFELFGQTNNSLTRENEGTGIGLYLVKQLIDALDAQIEVISKVGKGSSFIILLPNSKIKEKAISLSSYNLNDNKLIENINIEFSNINFD